MRSPQQCSRRTNWASKGLDGQTTEGPRWLDTVVFAGYVNAPLKYQTAHSLTGFSTLEKNHLPQLVKPRLILNPSLHDFLCKRRLIFNHLHSSRQTSPEQLGENNTHKMPCLSQEYVRHVPRPSTNGTNSRFPVRPRQIWRCEEFLLEWRP